MRRLVNTDLEEIDLEQDYLVLNREAKPEGLWYAIDHAWLDWCSGEMPEWVKDLLFSLRVDTKDILVLDTVDKVKSFIHRYSVPAWPQAIRLQSIKWFDVSKDYKGVEIVNYHTMRWNSELNDQLWLMGWDVDSGCIWDLSCINKVTQIPLPEEYKNLTTK